MSNAWIQHCKAFKADNPTKSWKECLTEAKATYTPVEKPEKSSEPRPNKWMEHIAKFKAENPDWKSKMSYKDVLVACKDTYQRD